MGRILKSVLLIVAIVIMLQAVTIAANKIGTMGAPNSDGVYPIEVYSDGSMKFTTASGTSLNWTDTKALGGGVNWASLDFQASKSINWTDTYNLTPAGSGTAKTLCIRLDGTIYGIAAGNCN